MAPDYATPGADRHVVITGVITGTIPTPDPLVQVDSLNVTPPMVWCDSADEALAIAHAIEDVHWDRGTHPVQEEVEDHQRRDDVSDAQRKQAKDRLAYKQKKIADRRKAHGKAAG